MMMLLEMKARRFSSAHHADIPINPLTQQIYKVHIGRFLPLCDLKLLQIINMQLKYRHVNEI